MRFISFFFRDSKSKDILQSHFMRYKNKKIAVVVELKVNNVFPYHQLRPDRK